MSDGPPRPLQRLSRTSCDEVVELLVACECVRDPARRAQLTRQLASAVDTDSLEQAQLRDTVKGWVAAFMAHERGLGGLLDAVRELEGTSTEMAAIDEWLDQLHGSDSSMDFDERETFGATIDESRDRPSAVGSDAFDDAPDDTRNDTEDVPDQQRLWPTAEAGAPADEIVARGTDPPASLGGGRDTLLNGTRAEGEPGQAEEGHADRIGSRIGNYQITRELGHGGMGVVYEGKHHVLDMRAVIKMLRSGLASDKSAVERFASEANFLAQLRHPGIVDVYDVGVHEDGTTFIVLELLRGETLEDRLQRVMVLPVAVALSFMRQVVRTLAAVHTHGIIHLDLKPANLFVTPDPEVPGGERIKILDFGISTLSSEGAARGRRRGLGTPGYMAPEQRKRTNRVDARADLYALGIILYRMLIGRLPFSSYDQRAQRMPRVRAQLANLAETAPELAVIIEQLLSELPTQRPESADALLVELLKVSERASSAQAAGQGAVADDPQQVPADRAGQELSADTSSDGDAHGSEGTDPLATLWRVPELPPHFLPRPADTQHLIDQLCAGHTTGGDTSPPPGKKYGVHGMGGLGKSVVAAAVARDETVRQHFVDGIFWLSVGQSPQLTSLQAQLARALGVEDTGFDSAADGAHVLADFLADKCALLILDDVWDAEHAARLEVVGTRGRILVTTRNLDVLTWRGAESYSLGVLTEEQALELLADWTDTPVADLADDAVRVAEACGRLPLALTIAGALVRKPSGSWGRVLGWLEEARLDKLRGQIPAYPYRNVFKALEASVTHLAVEDVTDCAEKCYIDLAVFAEDQLIPRQALAVLWERHGLDEADVDDLATSLATQALVSMDTSDAEFRIRLHDIQRAYVRVCAGDLAQLHGEFVDAYARRCDKGLVYGPTDQRAARYFYSSLPGHLLAAGREAELQALLINYTWIMRKLRFAGVAELLADYESCPRDSELSLLRDALRLSGHVIGAHPDQLASQLSGRLVHLRADNPTLRDVLDQVRRTTDYPWLEAITPHLTPPGGALMCTFEGHTEPVMSVALSADGERVASASFDGSVKLWEPVSGTLVRVLKGHEDAVVAVALSGDGDRALSGSVDGSSRFWNARTGKLLHAFESHQSSVNSVALDGRGRRALTGGEDGTVKYWDTMGKRLLWADRGHRSGINCVALANAGRRALSGSQDRTMRLVDCATGDLVRTLTGHTASVNSVAINGAGTLVLSGSDDYTMRLWDVRTGVALQTFVGHEGVVNSVGLSEDGQRALSGSDDHTVRLWDTESGRLLRTFSGHSHWVSSVALSARGRRAVSGSLDHTVKLWRSDSERELSAPTFATHGGKVNCVVLNATGERALSGSDDGTAVLWNASDGTIASRLVVGDARVRAVALAEDEHHALTGNDAGEVSLWAMDTGERVRTFDWRFAAVHALALSQQGRCALVGTADGSLTLWNTDAATCLETFAGHDAAVNAVALTADGERALSGSSDGTVKLWNTAAGQLISAMTGHTEAVVSVALSADGTRALSGSLDHTLRLWDCHTGQTLQLFRGHSSSVMAVALGAEGHYAFSGSYDRTVRLWELGTGASVLSCAHDAIVTCCDCSLPHSSVLVFGDDEGTVNFLRLRTGR